MPGEISGHNATDETPMYDMPLIVVFGGWGFGVEESIVCIGVVGVGVLSLAFCPEIARRCRVHRIKKCLH